MRRGPEMHFSRLCLFRDANHAPRCSFEGCEIGDDRQREDQEHAGMLVLQELTVYQRDPA